MFVVLNLSKKLDAFGLYRNCFYPLINDNTLTIVEENKKTIDESINYSSIKSHVEDVLVAANTNKYSLIILYDYEMQKKDFLEYSVTSLLNNLQKYVVDKLKRSYAIDNIFCVLLDETERDRNESIIDESLRESVRFDMLGFLETSDVNVYFTEEDMKIDEQFSNFVKEHIEDGKFIFDEKSYESFVKQKISPIEKRIKNFFNTNETSNNVWYKEKTELCLSEYKKELKIFLQSLARGEKTLENKNFNFKDFVENIITSYNEPIQNKVFRLKLLNNRGKIARGEDRHINYYKIISLINYLVLEDKKYVFGNTVTNVQNHYSVEVNINKASISSMLNSYIANLEREEKKLGDKKFNELEIEEFEYRSADDIILDNNKKYLPPELKFSLFNNDNDLNIIKEYASYLKTRYVDFVNYCNQRLRKYTDNLRIIMSRAIDGQKKLVSLNELQRIIDEKQEEANEVEEKITKNIPKDIILIDPQVFDENEKNNKKVVDILNKRITRKQFIFNLALIFVVSLFLIVPMTRRFDIGIIGIVYKSLMIMAPVILYAFLQIIFSSMQIKDAKKILKDMEGYTLSKINAINIDDEKFKIYISDIYRLMTLTKYIDKLKEIANSSSIDIDNYRHHKSAIEKEKNNIYKLSTFLNIIIDENESKIEKNIELNINNSIEENDVYCPLYYTANNDKNFVSINIQHTEKIKSELLNIVDNIKFDDDEVYDESIA